MSDAFDIPDATRRSQDRATSPEASVFVSANAGSGKTFVLSRRVIRLLLDGVPPGRILCLTFTKAAAAEMANRVFEELARWATLEEPVLAGVIAEIEGRPPNAERLRQARRLFARALETPGGLKIQTIHGFCEALLQRFPFEANIAGRFQVIDERTQDEWLAEGEAAVVLEAALDPEGPLGRAHAQLTSVRADATLSGLIRAVVGRRDTLRRWIRGFDGFDAALASLGWALGCRPGDTPESLAEAFHPSPHLPASFLAELTAALRAGSKTDCDFCDRLEAALAAPTAAERMMHWQRAFFTDTGTARKRLATKAIHDRFAGLDDLFGEEIARLEDLLARLAAARTRDLSVALLTLADAVIRHYETKKNFGASLDYDDLVARAADLLQRSDAAAWVQYKLDQGLDHLLVDEAQDTSPMQWRVVEALTGDFFGGESARGETRRTLFAVGDEKQSIYSFQGAAPHLFAEVERRTKRRVEDALALFERVRLDLSFRSAPDVVAAVDRVFASAAAAEGLSADGLPPAHTAARAHDPGLVEIWPEFETVPPEEPEAWETPVDRVPGGDASIRLAERIADEVAGWILRGERLPGTGKRIRAGDVLVLLRRRGPFVDALNRALKARAVPVAGADRLVLTDHIAVMDLVALARAMLLVEDDLTLATVLRSPLIGLSDDDLFELAYDRGRGTSLWRRLETDPRFFEAHKALAGWRAMAGRARPYEFFAGVLGRDGGRKRLRARLGPEVDDLLDEFLNLALAHERDETPSLQGFLHWLTAGAREVKREAEAARDEVRIMTVHGAKGLEAPIVFLVDHGQAPAASQHEPKVIPLAEDEGEPDHAPPLVVVAAKKERPPSVDAAIAVWRQKAEAEYRRLLYVGMTRARDRLIVCGTRRKTAHAMRWHALVSDALRPDAEQVTENGEVSAWRWRSGVGTPRAEAPEAARPDGASALPAWLLTPVPIAAEDARLRPSDAAETVRRAGPSGRSGDAVERGRLLHRLLERLPELPAATRRATGAAFLAAAAPGMDTDRREALLDETMAVLGHADFATVFAEGGRAEVTVVGRVTLADGSVARVDGRVDRLTISGDRVLIVDYKTDLRPPQGPEELGERYLAQLASYAELLGSIYPGRRVEAALLFTAVPKLMPVPAALLDGMRRRLFAAP
jgi:ATP-dependent helicase/nuclease subunit A